MGRRNKKGRDISGIVIVDKPTGSSSNHVLQQVKRLFDAKKAGHTGSLDPLASGVLPICLGEATKLSGYLLDSDKAYEVTCQLGVVTDSGDADGEVIEILAIPEFDEQTLLNTIRHFIGELDQVPPMFSALKHEGQPLYKLARQGIEIERKSRRITIHAIQLLNWTTDSFTLAVRCSKGTYIRTLVEDISHRLGSGGHVTMLRRTHVAGYDLQDSITLDALKLVAEQNQSLLDTKILPSENALADWPDVKFNAEQTQQIYFGQPVMVQQHFVSANVRLFNDQKQFIGLGEMSPEGEVQPKRLFVMAS